MSDFWTVRKPTTHMRQLCRELGPEYTILVLDLEQVIYRDFGNGYNVEISRMNTSSKRKRASLYLWFVERIKIKSVHDVPQDEIGERVEELRAYTEKLVETGFDPQDLFHGKPLPSF